MTEEERKVRKFNAKKYFIYGFKEYITNKNKIMARKYVPSIREVLVDYIQMYEDRIKDTKDVKLQRAEKELIEETKYYIQGSIFYEHKIYIKELNLLMAQLHIDDEKQEVIATNHKAYIMCKSLIKKINYENFYVQIINVLKTTSSYEIVDRIIESIVSELLYDGYSLKHLDTWYNKCLRTRDISEENIDEKLHQFTELKAHIQDIEYFITIKGYCRNEITLDYNLVLRQVQDINEVIPETYRGQLQMSSDTTVYSLEVRAMDVDKGIEYLLDAFEAYFHMINYVIDNNKVEIGEKILAYVKKDEEYHKIRKNVQDEVTIFSTSESRERQDVEDFIRYRDSLYSEQQIYDEVANIQRALNIVKGQKEQSKENKIINLWSVLEYVLTFHEGKNIISKVKDIIPKIICLYEIKESINSFWLQLYRYKDSNNLAITEFIEACKKNEEGSRYDLHKFIEYVNTQGSSLSGKLAFNDLLARGICEIGSILFDEKYRQKYVEKIYNNTLNDLTKIYRDRNVLIHSGRSNISNINLKVLRLYRYNNSLLGVIIYYKSKNPTLTIQEILSSIEHTYKNYIELIGTTIAPQKLIEVCRPTYLFLE